VAPRKKDMYATRLDLQIVAATPRQ
jgi:hypothetical protein